MLSSDRGRWGRRNFGPIAILAVVATLGLSACTVQPLYGTRPDGSSVATTLRSIVIEPVDTRVAQEVRNELLFYLTGGGEVVDPQYRLRLRVTSYETALGIRRTGSAPVYSVNVVATYSLYRIGSNDIILRETARGTASYDRGNQGFANVRAKLDAEDRAATQAADEIRLRLAAATATGF